MRTVHIDKYYTSMEHLIKVYEKDARQMGFKACNIDEYNEWKNKSRLKLAEITGINRMQKCDPEVKSLETVKLDGYTREKMIIQTEPDVWMPFYVLKPDGIKEKGKLPCMIAPHGHDCGGRYAVAGMTEIPVVRERLGIYRCSYGVDFVKQGFIVFCPEARAFGERREWTGQADDDASFINSTCSQLNHMAICLGQSVTGMWVWDLMRLLDYIETRDDCDHDRIGCGGLSGGGFQTIWLSAMDDRVKCSITSGYFYGYKDATLKLSNNCACNYVPNLWLNFDMGDLGALIAPRPFLIESGSKDGLNGERGLDNVKEQVEIAKKAYSLFNADDKIYHHIFVGGHMWEGKMTYPFVKKWLMG